MFTRQPVAVVSREDVDQSCAVSFVGGLSVLFFFLHFCSPCVCALSMGSFGFGLCVFVDYSTCFVAYFVFAWRALRCLGGGKPHEQDQLVIFGLM